MAKEGRLKRHIHRVKINERKLYQEIGGKLKLQPDANEAKRFWRKCGNVKIITEMLNW